MNTLHLKEMCHFDGKDSENANARSNRAYRVQQVKPKEKKSSDKNTSATSYTCAMVKKSVCHVYLSNDATSNYEWAYFENTQYCVPYNPSAIIPACVPCNV